MKKFSLYKLKTIGFISIFFSPAFCLEAPFLISVSSLNDSSIQVVWRNNDINSEGFIIQRSDSTEQTFHTVSTINSPIVLSIIDAMSIHPLTTYRYQVIAFQGEILSDTSNHLQVKAPAANLKMGTFLVDWNCDFSKYAKLIILDSSKSENGYYIYKKDDTSVTFDLIFDIKSIDPLTTDSIIIYDSSVSNNRMYDYYAVAYNQSDSLAIDTCSIFTYHEVYPSTVVRLSKVSEFPISAGGWSAKAGDSIILKENNSPVGKYSVINIRTPGNPEFDGYIDSNTLMTYQASTLIPFFLKFGVSNSKLSQNVILYKKYLIVKTKSDSLNLYKLNGDTCTFQSTLSVSGISWLFRTNDLLIYKNNYLSSSPLSSYQYSILQIQPSGSLLPLSPVFINRSRGGMGADGFTEHTVLGITDGKNLLIGVDDYFHSTMDGYTTSAHNVIVYNIESDKMMTLSADDYLSETFNTGFYISSNEFIGLRSQPGAFELFVSPVSSTRGYRIAAKNNSVYKDSTITKNMLQNILIDTLSKNIFLITDNKLITLEYESKPSA